MKRFTLYGSPHSLPTYKVALMLRLSDEPFSFRYVSFQKGMHKTPEFQALSRWGQVPVLVDWRTASTSSRRPSSSIWPRRSAGFRGHDPATRQAVREWLYWDVDVLFPPIFNCYGVQLGRAKASADQRRAGDSAPGETTGARTQGSSEAIMLGALSLKWKWRARQLAAGRPTDRPNLVFGGDVHVVWEKFCRYFDVEPRIVPLLPGKYTIGPEDVLPHLDENTIGVAAVLGTTFTGHRDDIVGINDLLVRVRTERDLDIPLHVDGASGGFVWPFLYPDSPWDFRLEQVRWINVSGHKFGLVYPGIGWLVFRERSDLPDDLVFKENYLGKTDETFTLNFSTGASMVVAQYYNFVRYGRAGYGYIMRNMQTNAHRLADKLEEIGRFEVIGRDEEQLPLVAFRLAGKEPFDEFDVAWQVSAERGWMLPAYTLPPDAQNVTIMRALVKQTLSQEHVDTLARDIHEACDTLEKKGGAHESERAKMVVGPGH